MEVVAPCFQPLKERLHAFNSGRMDLEDWAAGLTRHITIVNPKVNALIDWTPANIGPGTIPISVSFKESIECQAPIVDKLTAPHASGLPEINGAYAAISESGFFSVGSARATEHCVGMNILDCVNPIFPLRSPSGSSNGSAVAVAAGLCDISVGTDAAGSVRRPAGNCGAVGLMCSHRPKLLERVRCVSPSIESLGVMARSVEDLTLAWDLANLDSVFTARKTADHKPDRRIRLGLVGNVEDTKCNPKVWNHLLHLSDILTRNGFEIERVQLDWWPLRETAWSILGYELYHLHEDKLRRCPQSYSARTREIILAGAKLSRNAYEADLSRCAEGRAAAAAFFAETNLDGLLLPTDSDVPYPISAIEASGPIPSDAAAVPFDTQSYTSLANICGLPALVLPTMLDNDGYALSAQIYGHPEGERGLLEVGRRIEQIVGDWLPWRLRREALDGLTERVQLAAEPV